MTQHMFHDYVELDGLRTHLIRLTQDIDTVFLHGVGGCCWTFAHTLSALEVEMNWASIDLLGYGESSWLPDTADYSTQRQARRVCDVLDHLGVSKVNLVGFSWGGLIALEVAAQWQGVDKLVMIDIPPSSHLSPDAVAPIPWRYNDIGGAIETMARLAPSASRVVIERDAQLSTTFDEHGLRRKLDPRLLQRYFFRTEEHWESWDANNRDTLLIRGERSQVLSSDAAATMMKRAPSASYVEIAEAGHMIPLEQPRHLAQAISDFVR